MNCVYKNVRLKGKKDLIDILVEDGVFKKIGNNIQGDKEVDLKGNLVLPPYVDPHIHLDYVFTARKDGALNGTGTLFEGIQRWSETKSDLTIEEIKERAKLGIKKEMLNGVQFIRTHADVTDPSLISLKALLELREELKDIVTIQVVAFPQEGMYAYKGGDLLVEEALKMGADCVGAIPHFEFAREFGEKSIHKTVELALKYNKLIDVHCDETDDDQSRFLELLAALAYMNDIGHLTTASHTCSFGSVNNAYAFKLMKLLKQSKVNFIACPTENIYLQGRQDTYPKRRGLTRVKELNDANINVCFAQDSMSDPWYPLGNGNMMMILDHGIHIAQMMSFEEIDNALDLITTNGAITMNIQDQYGIEEGKPANFIVLNAKSEFEAVCERAGVLASIRNGKTLFWKEPEVVKTEVEILKQI
ncbi:MULTISPECIES: cytosine deaminase [unclassified Clostridium]|uniref:cytosine deaminase n=1 Tax=Clostridium TaxID=1485 RepID=UPI001C8CDCAE|nr:MULTISPECIES: cytosine deaminase [unclassified Clostridium]MBX9137192.1 cytosine deaminase [Clostridium sp. K12(2020)]MBX9143957.1 cytosine deaminase [Clostridium sp. K13]MDU2291186.1 cytosine deaminase [Clostridium celatum]MDU4326852.1 cytosine deaminase [Clostridium celatum]